MSSLASPITQAWASVSGHHSHFRDASCPISSVGSLPLPSLQGGSDVSSGSFVSSYAPYVPCRLLGIGCFGEAFLAHHRDRPNHFVVLKVPRGVDPVRAAEASRVLRHEASLLRTLHHPRIVPFLDYVENPDCNFVVMPHVAGGSLAGKLHSLPGSRLPAPQVARLLLDVLQALEHVHMMGVMHLDVK